MNKILLKIINNKQLEDVLSIDQPTAHVSPKQSTSVSDGPQPTRTVSTVVSTKTNNKDTATRQRRRTISYWGKVPPPVPTTPQDTDDDKRRHSSIVQQSPNPEKSASTSNSGWAKALRRMSGIGWTAVKEDNTPVVNNDSAVGSISEKTSGSSNSSVRGSNELGTLNEE